MIFTGFRKYIAALSADNNQPIWVPLWALGLAIGWLLPNHTPPWIAFHVDAWIAWFFLTAALVLVSRTRALFSVPREALGALLVAAIPGLQYALGLLPYAGMAWIATVFLLGFACAIIFGSAWEKNQPDVGVNALFFAIGVASVGSVAIQLYQWLGLNIDSFEMWFLAVPDNRPFGNLAQPNQLATLLVWGLIATAWAVTKNKLSRPVAVLLALFLLIGVTLTQSKTAFIAVLTAAPFAWQMQRFGVTRSSVWMVVGLTTAFLAMAWALPHLDVGENLTSGSTMLQRDSSSLRLAAYRMFIDAAFQSPWVGYGWSQTALAQLHVAAEHPPMNAIFMQSHNLFLDLVVWCGLPVGLLISVAVICWLIWKALNITSLEVALQLAFVGAIGWHAMVELPLQYAYFLLPTGLVIGSIAQRTSAGARINIRWTYAMGIFVVIGGLLAGVTRDYLAVEKSFLAMRFERARIGAWPVGLDVNPVLLDQLEAFVDMGRRHATRNMTDGEIQALRKAAGAYPSLGNFYTLIIALSLNGQIAEAQTLVDKMPKITTEKEYTQMKYIGIQASMNDSALAQVHWPAIKK
jgi:hypothetical protein